MCICKCREDCQTCSFCGYPSFQALYHTGNPQKGPHFGLPSPKLAKIGDYMGTIKTVAHLNDDPGLTSGQMRAGSLSFKGQSPPSLRGRDFLQIRLVVTVMLACCLQATVLVLLLCLQCISAITAGTAAAASSCCCYCYRYPYLLLLQLQPLLPRPQPSLAAFHVLSYHRVCVSFIVIALGNHPDHTGY